MRTLDARVLTLSIVIDQVVELAEAESNAVRDISTDWTKVREVVCMEKPLSDTLRTLVDANPELRYWTVEATPHNRSECGFTDDSELVSISFPASGEP